MAQEEQTINLKILSPSTEVEGGVNLADVPASTTVKELRSRIQNAVPSKPATDRMRLIYRGRVIANDAESLGNVFGTDNVCLLPLLVDDTDIGCRYVRTRTRAFT